MNALKPVPKTLKIVSTVKIATKARRHKGTLRGCAVSWWQRLLQKKERKPGNLLSIKERWSLKEPETRRREIKGLTATCKRYKLSKGMIITDDEEEIILDDGIEIKVIPAFKFLLDFKNFEGLMEKA